MTVAVVLAGWEVECCVPPPGVGDEVVWPLRWYAGADLPGSCSLLWQVDDTEPCVLRVGPLTAWCPTLEPGAGRLSAELHGQVPEQVPPVRGTVRRVRVVRQTYREVRPASWEAVPGRSALRDVRRSPRWFAVGAPAGAGQRSADQGLLLDLDVVQ